MIKALRAAAAKVPFQKDKMASPSRGAALPQPAGRAAWWGSDAADRVELFPNAFIWIQ